VTIRLEQHKTAVAIVKKNKLQDLLSPQRRHLLMRILPRYFRLTEIVGGPRKKELHQDIFNFRVHFIISYNNFLQVFLLYILYRSTRVKNVNENKV
jgi:hypothetical protein